MRWLYSITNAVDMNLSTLEETVEDKGAQCATIHEVTESHRYETEQMEHLVTVLLSRLNHLQSLEICQSSSLTLQRFLCD